MGALTEALQSAYSEPDDREHVRRTKQAMIGAIEELDPTARVKDTGWFNHSAMPDLVLSWANKSDEREVYIRSSHEGIAASHDIERLGTGIPVIVAVQSGDDKQRAATQQRLQGLGGTPAQPLVADAASIDTLITPRTKSRTSPLAAAVSSHLLPSGHGLLTEDRVDTIVSPSPEVLESLETLLSPEAYSSVITVAEIVAAATSKEGVLARLESEQPFGSQEARDLLPWLLGDDVTNETDAFWQAIADRTSLQVLETIAEDLADIDLTRICARSLDVWTPKRGALGLAARDSDGHSRPDGWFMEGKALTRIIGEDALRVASSGRTLREHGSTSSATWELTRTALGEGVLRSIVLRGLERSIRVGAEESADVKADVDAILRSVKDRYYVDELVVAFGAQDEDRRVRTVMGDRIAENLGKATMGDLLRVLASVASHRNPITLEELLAD